MLAVVNPIIELNLSSHFKANMEDLLHSIDETVVEKLSLKAQPESLLHKIKGGKFIVDQGVIAGCAGGTYSNIVEAAHALKDASTGYDEFYLSVYPSSQPVFVDLDRNDIVRHTLVARIVDAYAADAAAKAKEQSHG